MATRLFVGGLSWDTTDDKLRDFFSQVGTVGSATVITDKFTGKSKGFGFVEMSTDAEAEEAIKKLNGQNLDGRDVAVNTARPMEERGPRNFEPRRDFGGGGRPFRRNTRGGDNRRGRY